MKDKSSQYLLIIYHVLGIILEKAMAPHSSTLAWGIPWMEEAGGLKSMGSRRVRHDCATSLSFSLSCIGEGNGNPLQYSCLENPRDRGAWWAAIYGVAQSQARLNRLSSRHHFKSFTYSTNRILKLRNDNNMLQSYQ